MPNYLHRTLTAATAAVCLSIAVASCGDDPAGPDPVALPMTWNFDSGLEGWSVGSRTSGDGGGSAIHDAGSGSVVLSGAGAPGTADSWMSLQLTVPAGATGQAWIDVIGQADCLQQGGGDTQARLTVTASGGATTVIDDWHTIEPGDTPVNLASASVEQFAGQAVTITFEQDDEGEQEEGDDAEFLCVSRIEMFDD